MLLSLHLLYELYELLTLQTACYARDTALHSSKDLAVSPPVLPQGLTPKGSLHFRSGRLCSHLWNYFRRALPATLLYGLRHRSVRTFLPYLHRSDYLIGVLLLYHFLYRNQTQKYPCFARVFLCLKLCNYFAVPFFAFFFSLCASFPFAIMFYI